MNFDAPRLIEVAFPLKQTSLDSVHEKNVRHGHISTLHIWPARRPLAACRAALIATLLPDPCDKIKRNEMLDRLGGRVVQVVKRKKMPNGKIEEVVTEETVGGILHWGRESGPDLDWFRTKIRESYGGRAPRVLDPFAGGGAIPLEAMRLGCDATAVDINPVAWFILKCTLEYPQKMAGQKRRLPDFVLKDREFMAAFLESQGLKGATLRTQLDRIEPGEAQQAMPAVVGGPSLDADMAWHVRAWGRWVLQRARAELEPYYPVVDGKATVAYLWARTLKCKNPSCGATIPLLKTRWLCKKDQKRVVLTMEPNSDKTTVTFGVQADVPIVGANAAQRREHDKRLGSGTMSRSGVTCPCCKAVMTLQDIRLEGQAGHLGMTMTAVVVDSGKGKGYRLPTQLDIESVELARVRARDVFADIPFDMPLEPTPAGGGTGAGRAFSVQGYGLMRWADLFTPRQLFALGSFVRHTRATRPALLEHGYPQEWSEAILAYLSLAVDRLADAGSSIAHWQPGGEFNVNTFQRFALPISWDFAEVSLISDLTGGYPGAVTWIALACSHFLSASAGARRPQVLRGSAVQVSMGTSARYDVIVTDPPYYDAIPYSDLMDFFHVWLRRTTNGLSPECDEAFADALGPKWNRNENDGELIDDSSRHGGDAAMSKNVYESGMARAFKACHDALEPQGKLVVVFAHKQPDAWETLVAAIIRSGFVVDGSWPLQTERMARTRSLSSAALSSSVWLVCRKRPEMARPGWDNLVLTEMRERIQTQLHDFWDAGIRGPDFVWAATGPAMESYSKYPVVKKANKQGEVLTVREFLRHVRRIVVDFVVGRVLACDGNSDAVSGLDDVTTYYLLHRHDFKMEDAPAGACILYAISCGLSDTLLADQFDILLKTGGQEAPEEDEQTVEEEGDVEEGTGSKVKLRPWQQRKRSTLGYEAPAGRPVPLIDQVHRLMHLWKAGEVSEVNSYLDTRGLRRNALFSQLLQALIELSPAGSEERSLLESISNHVVAGASSGLSREGRESLVQATFVGSGEEVE